MNLPSWLPPRFLALLVFSACQPVEEVAAVAAPNVGSQTNALAGVEGMFEYALDAPWRMEPKVTTTLVTIPGKGGPIQVPLQTTSFDPIPLQITIDDADRVADDAAGATQTPFLGKVCGLIVTEAGVDRFYPVESFEEVEWSRRWTWGGAAPTSRSCSKTATTNCSAEAWVLGTAEWHALVLYTPLATAQSGLDLPLAMRVRVTRGGSTDCNDTSPAKNLSLRGQVRVHYGEAGLPRFGSTWAYGDLHYHAQGTDNEGESAYNYRGVLRAMRSVGLDFAWATEHASASEQFMDVDLSLSGVDNVEAKATRGVLRDMSDLRFRTLRSVAASANAAAATRHTGQSLIPQLFVGGELDAIPESMPVPGPSYYQISYGANRVYDLQRLCGGWHDDLDRCNTSGCEASSFLCCDYLEVSSSSCNLFSSLYAPATGGGVLIRDIQSVNQVDFGREHLVYLPDPARDDGFVASQTGVYGGAQRQLVADRGFQNQFKGLLPEVEQKGGSVFLAHHLNAPDGSEGPDGPPWSPHMLDKAFQQKSVIGLEFWNENSRRRSTPTVVGYSRNGGFIDSRLRLTSNVYSGLNATNGVFDLTPFDLATGQYGSTTAGVEDMLVQGSASWDRLNLKGLDPAQTASLTWLPSGQPRKLFIAAGSDAHGDFNYRREGYMEGTTAITDAALGTPRNLVDVGVRAANGTFAPGSVLAALRAGHFTATDGPALRIVLDLNGNGVIDAGEPTMGDTTDIAGLRSVPVLVEWTSTAEFGGVARIELVVGVWGANGLVSEGRLYAGGCGFLPCTAIDTPVVRADGLVGLARRPRVRPRLCPGDPRPPERGHDVRAVRSGGAQWQAVVPARPESLAGLGWWHADSPVAALRARHRHHRPGGGPRRHHVRIQRER
jgi:hypothetical protein